METATGSGDVDDAAIWIHPTDPALSTVIGTAKTSANSLRVYDLSGQLIGSAAIAQVNNIDLRYNFPLGGQRVALLAGSNRSNDSIALFRIDPVTRQLHNVVARTIATNMAIYGCTMYVSPTTGDYFAFVTSESGQVQQWRLFDAGGGQVDATLVRSFYVGSQAEGIVADDVLGHLYVGEEDRGIWKYSAEPNGGSARTQVDKTGSGGHLRADVEGLTIYYASNGTGYLLASSQGSDDFAIYRREGNNTYVGSFALVAGGGIDAVSNTDGIDVTNFSLGGQFPHGLFVAQDNGDNFKLVRWDAVDAALGGVLTTDTTWDPRLVGKPVQPPALPGDYDGSGVVDMGDYVVWRVSLGTSGVPQYTGADGSGNGAVDAADLAVWRANFGKHAPSASSASSANSAGENRAEAAVSLASVSTALVDRGATADSRHDPARRPRAANRRAAFAATRDAALVAWLTAPPLEEHYLTETAACDSSTATNRAEDRAKDPVTDPTLHASAQSTQSLGTTPRLGLQKP